MASDTWRTRIAATETAFFLDVDGTLLGFKSQPEEVVADDGLRTLLSSLRIKAGGALALVSGRTLSDLDRIVAPLELAAGGTHGAELRFADGRRMTADTAALDDVRAAACRFVDEHLGLRLEDKGSSLAIHYRNAPQWSADLTAFLERIVVGDNLMIQHGKMVVEVKSARSDKGTAIGILMQSVPFAGRTPLFIGDDLTDEHGFAAVRDLHGISVKVGPGDTSAEHRLDDPSQVHDFLRQIAMG